MNLSQVKDHFYKFSSIRKEYKEKKKQLIMNYIETRNPEIKTELENVQKQFHSDFIEFGKVASEYSPKELFEIVEDDYIFWLCFAIEDFFQEAKEEILKDDVMKKLEWKPKT